jgi:hypothetical protein
MQLDYSLMMARHLQCFAGAGSLALALPVVATAIVVVTVVTAVSVSLRPTEFCLNLLNSELCVSYQLLYTPLQQRHLRYGTAGSSTVCNTYAL